MQHCVAQGIDVDKVSDTFMQCVADNVDHDSRRLVGNGTIQCIGSEVTLTPAIKSVREIARKKINEDGVKEIGCINIVFQADPKESDVARGESEDCGWCVVSA